MYAFHNNRLLLIKILEVFKKYFYCEDDITKLSMGIFQRIKLDEFINQQFVFKPINVMKIDSIYNAIKEYSIKLKIYKHLTSPPLVLTNESYIENKKEKLGLK